MDPAWELEPPIHAAHGGLLPLLPTIFSYEWRRKKKKEEEEKGRSEKEEVEDKSYVLPLRIEVLGPPV